MKRANLILLLLFMFLTCANHYLPAASESFIDSIYKADKESAAKQDLDEIEIEQGGVEVEEKVVEVYQPDMENRLMDDIFRLLKQAKSVKVIDLRLNVKIVKAKLSKNLGRSVGIITVRTLKVGNKKSAPSTDPVKKPKNTGIVVTTKPASINEPTAKPVTKPEPVGKPKTTIQVRKPTPPKVVRPVAKPVIKPVNSQARITDSPESLINRLNKMGFEIEGGIKSSGGRWDSEQLFYLIKLVESLPPHFSITTKKFKRVANFGGNRGVMGYVFAGQPTVHITDWGVRPTKFEETLVHEMAHCWMFSKENVKAKEAYCNIFWPGNKQPNAEKEQPTSVYGHTNVFEDFAEAVRYYWQDCPKMRATHPQRWAFLNKYVFKGVSYLSRQNIASANSKTLANHALSARQY